MSAHLKQETGPRGDRAKEFDKLRAEMAAALEALPAWPELRAVFEERWAHIERTRYVMATCYKMAPWGSPPGREAVEQQVKELEQLVADGKLTEQAARKAAATLAVQAEYLRRVQEVEEPPYTDETYRKLAALWEDYRAGKVEADAPAAIAGQRLAELTVDKLGWLAGPPKANEGAE